MKTKHLLRKIKHLLSADKRKQLAKFDSLEKVLRKLKKKEAALREKLDGEKSKDKRRELEKKLEVVAAQRKKGRKLRDKLEKQRSEE